MLLFQFLLLYFLFIFMRNLVFPQPENKQWNTVEDVVLIPILSISLSGPKQGIQPSQASEGSHEKWVDL